MKLIGGGLLLVVLAANAPGWAAFLLWAAFAAPVLGLVAHLRGAPVVIAVDLCAALALLFADLPADRSCAAAHAIVAEAGGEDVALLAAIGVGESGLNPWKVGDELGACGTMQVVWSLDRARQDRRCRRILGDHRAAIRAGVAKLRDARAYCHGRAFRHLPIESCALAGYQAGPKGVRALAAGADWPLVRQAPVLARAALIRRAVEARAVEAM